MNYIEGGVCAPKGFTAAGMHVGIRANKEKNDLMVIFSMHPCSSAGIFTKNIVCSGPVKLNRKNIIAGNACAFIANSGIANACCPNCNENALRMQHAAAQALKIENEQVLVASTGIIGVRLPVEKIENNISELVSRLENSAEGSNEAALAIMTTDTRKKRVCYFRRNLWKNCNNWGNCQRKWHDSPKYGNYALLFNNGLLNFCVNA